MSSAPNVSNKSDDIDLQTELLLVCNYKICLKIVQTSNYLHGAEKEREY